MLNCVTHYSNYVSPFVNSVRWNSISDEGRAALEMMVDEMNSKQGPDKDKIKLLYRN